MTFKISMGDFNSLLLTLFIVLKLTKFISWSWLWVFAPLWIPIALLFLIFAVMGVLSMITENKKDSKK